MSTAPQNGPAKPHEQGPFGGANRTLHSFAAAALFPHPFAGLAAIRLALADRGAIRPLALLYKGVAAYGTGTGIRIYYQ